MHDRLLLAHGARPDVHDFDGETPLTRAIVEESDAHVKAVMDVLPQLADLRNVRGWRPVEVALRAGRYASARLLLGRGVAEPQHASALHCALATRDTLALRTHIRRGADVSEVVDAESQQQLVHRAAMDDNLAAMRWLLQHGASKATCDRAGSTPLHLACIHGHLDIVRYLLDIGCSVNEPDGDGATPLLLACMARHQHVVAELAARPGVDANCSDVSGLTPLHQCCFSGFLDPLPALVLAGALASRADHNGATPLHVACARQHRPAIDALVEHFGVGEGGGWTWRQSTWLV